MIRSIVKRDGRVVLYDESKIAGAILNVFVSVFFPMGWSLEVFKTVSFYLSAAIFAVMLVLALKKVHPIVIVLISAGAGIAIGYLGLW